MSKGMTQGRFTLRVPQDRLDALAADAKKAHRSVNAQINYLIERHLRGTA